MDILGFTLLGNNLVQYGLFVGILALTILCTKLLYMFFKKVFRVFTQKTDNKLDDIIVESLEAPVLFSFFLGGFYYSMRFLSFSEFVQNIVDKILMAFIVLVVAWVISRIVRSVMMVYLKPLADKTESDIDDVLLPVLSKISTFVIFSIAIILVVQNLGFQVTSLVTGLGIGGLALALAAQDILGNLFGGAAVITDKPFKIGDRIKTNGFDGFVKEIGIRTTILVTFDGTHILVPNKLIADSITENISRERARRTKVILGLEYSTSTKKLEQAKKILERIVLKNDKTDDKSLIHFVKFNDYSLDIQLIYWIKDLDNILSTRDEINFAIKKEFEKVGLEFAFPTQTIRVEKQNLPFSPAK